MASFDRRLARLEDEVRAGAVIYVWRELGQTAADAIAAKFPDGTPMDCQLASIGWMESGSAEIH